jgi:cyclin B
MAKRMNGVKTRSMAADAPAVGNDVVVARPGAFVNRMEQRNPMAEDRDNAMQLRAAMQADPSSYQMTGTVDNIDDRDSDDPLCTTSYVNDMYVHFREKEVFSSVRPIYMENQTHINERMRSILVDWLVEVHLKFKLVPETLYLTINMIDRFLEKERVSRPRLQLVGVTSLLIASKYEEIFPPELRDLVYICDKAYTKQDVSYRLSQGTCQPETFSSHILLFFRFFKWRNSS